MNLIQQILIISVSLLIFTHQQTISLNIEQNNNYQAYYRELVKRENLKLIEELNQNEDYTFHVSPNKFLSLKNDEFYNMYTTTIKMQSSDESEVIDPIQQKTEDQTTMKGASITQKQTSSIETLIAPSKSSSINIDLFTTPVKDQGKCNSCYAHSTIATVESLLYRKYNQTFDLSQQQIVDCTIDWAPKQHDIYNNRGCVGGWGWVSYQYLKSYGITYEDDYPYRSKRTGTQSMCRWNYITNKKFK